MKEIVEDTPLYMIYSNVNDESFNKIYIQDIIKSRYIVMATNSSKIVPRSPTPLLNAVMPMLKKTKGETRVRNTQHSSLRTKS